MAKKGENSIGHGEKRGGEKLPMNHKRKKRGEGGKTVGGEKKRKN